MNNYTRLDDIAYDLYWTETRNKVLTVFKEYFVINKILFDNYYQKANIKLRKEKIENLNSL